MVFGFAKRSAGHVNAYSEPGVGTTIHVYLPRHHSGTPTAVVDAQRQPLPRGTESLLVVDDEQGLLEVARAHLESLGYNVHAAADATEALSVIANQPSISLMFTDVVMPGGLNGYQLAAETRKIRADLKILVTSGYAGQALRGGEDLPMLAKPYAKSELAELVRRLLDQDVPL